MSTLAELIARMEKATGPDRESDFLIFEAAAWRTEYFGSKIESWSRAGGAGYTVNTADGIRHLSAFNAPFYTTSIDAALTLVADGDGCSLERHWIRSGVQWTAAIFTGGVPSNPARQFTADAPAPAIALCIAALKARAQAEIAP